MEERDKVKPKARLHAIIHGRVQGVNFRYYTTHTAQRLGLTGWVANRWDGTVEIIAEGARESLDEFRAFLHRGSPSAFVQRVDDEWEAPTGEFQRFGVRYS
ncbi:MAG: acylphosphatase [Chloroflexi bacterium]|nr:MAG: acylphosphatase [Chloroflexota bacterium]